MASLSKGSLLPKGESRITAAGPSPSCTGFPIKQKRTHLNFLFIMKFPPEVQPNRQKVAAREKYGLARETDLPDLLKSQEVVKRLKEK